jgi:hypothetical protein
LHMPTMDRIDGAWSLRRLAVRLGLKDNRPIPGASGWPDTETLLGLQLRGAGIVPKVIGREKNYERTLDENIDHCRSQTGSQLYGRSGYRDKCAAWVADAMKGARERIALWSGMY